jgi:hypothetical protein
MSGHNIITRLSLTGSSYEADLSFPVSFGRIGYTMKGEIDLSGDPPLSRIHEMVLDATYDDLKNVPAIYQRLPIRAV